MPRLLIAGAIVLLVFAVAVRAQQPVPAFEDVVARLIGVNESLHSFKVEQDIEVRVWFLRYRIRSTVYAARPARYRVEIHNMPWFLRSVGSAFSFVGRPEDVLTLYAPQRVEWRAEESGRRLYLDLLRREARVNPPRAEAFIDPERWLFDRMALHYEWGTIDADYAFGVIDGFLLPLTITMRVPAYRVTARISYRNYQLNVPLPDSVFSTR